MSLFTESRAYKIVSGDVSRGRVSHAYLLVCPDERNLRTFLKELAKLVMRADERAARLIDEEMHSDCRVFPAEGEKTAVSDVKELLEGCYIKPVEGDKKVFVLDRMQEMLPPAQNKLLKVLEEPPENVYFILGTTSEFPVLTTVKSRSKRLDLFSFPQEKVERYIAEKYPFRPDAQEIAAASGGVLGVAESMAESEGQGEDAALFALNLSPASIPLAAKKYSSREELAKFLPMLRIAYRDMLLCKLGREDLLLAGGDKKIIRRAAARYTVAALVNAQERIGEFERDLKFNANAQAGMEALLAGILEGR